MHTCRNCGSLLGYRQGQVENPIKHTVQHPIPAPLVYNRNRKLMPRVSGPSLQLFSYQAEAGHVPQSWSLWWSVRHELHYKSKRYSDEKPYHVPEQWLCNLYAALPLAEPGVPR